MERMEGEGDRDRARAEVSFIAEQLDLVPGASVLDVACGAGRHSMALAERGFRVTGVDSSAMSLERARRVGAEANLGVCWIERDMRVPLFDAEFDAAINMFNSFGYLENEDEDQRALDAIGRALRPGGLLFIEHTNVTGVLRTYQRQRWGVLRRCLSCKDEHSNRVRVERVSFEVAPCLLDSEPARASIVRSSASG